MSSSNAAAIKRRANPGTASLSQQQQPMAPKPTPGSANDNSPGLTLPQVIALVDKRLIKLETFMNTASANMGPSSSTESSSQPANQLPMNAVDKETFEQIMESMTAEINSRFEIFAEEISNLKEIVLKLQSYTMDVNQALFNKHMTSLEKQGGDGNTLENNADVSSSINLQELVKEEFNPNNIIFSQP
jgi:hypothetical protein